MAYVISTPDSFQWVILSGFEKVIWKHSYDVVSAGCLGICKARLGLDGKASLWQLCSACLPLFLGPTGNHRHVLFMAMAETQKEPSKSTRAFALALCPFCLFFIGQSKSHGQMQMPKVKKYTPLLCENSEPTCQRAQVERKIKNQGFFIMQCATTQQACCSYTWNKDIALDIFRSFLALTPWFCLYFSILFYNSKLFSLLTNHRFLCKLTL